MGRTLDEFLRGDGKLWPAEQALLEACASGDWATIPADQRLRDACDRGETLPDGRPRSCNETNRIRAAFLRFLALGGDAGAVLHEHALRVAGAWIDGRVAGARTDGLLDFEGCKVPAWLEFVSCTIDGRLQLTDAEIRGLSLKDTGVSEIDGQRLHSLGIFALTEATYVNGRVGLNGARIDGALNCAGCHINGDDGNALSVVGADIKGSVSLSNKFNAKGQVDLSGANIAEDLNCSGGCFEGHSVKADGKEMRGWALNLDQVEIGASVMLGCSEDEEKADGKEKKTFFHARGGVRMHTSRIAGNLICEGGRFEGSAENAALLLEGAEIKGNVYLTSNEEQKFHATGKVHLVNAEISGDLDCSGGSFDGWPAETKNGEPVKRRDLALFGNGANIAGSVLLTDGFHADGGVQFRGVTIDGNLDCQKGKFNCESSYRALDLEDSDIKRWFYFRDVKAVTGRVTLTAARVGTLADDKASWDKVQPHNLDLDGFRYDRFAEEDDSEKAAAPTDANSRIMWLEKQRQEHLAKRFKPQPWDQLIKVLHDTGYAEDAIKVAIEKNWRQFRNNFGPLRLLYGWLYGFGYRPNRVLWAAFFIWGFGAGAFYYGADSRLDGANGP